VPPSSGGASERGCQAPNGRRELSATGLRGPTGVRHAGRSRDWALGCAGASRARASPVRPEAGYPARILAAGLRGASGRIEGARGAPAARSASPYRPPTAPLERHGRTPRAGSSAGRRALPGFPHRSMRGRPGRAKPPRARSRRHRGGRASRTGPPRTPAPGRSGHSSGSCRQGHAVAAGSARCGGRAP